MNAKPRAEDFAAQAAKYLGTSYSQLDCQALMEAMLRDVGVKANWAGSNAMYRDMAWVGTPEDCKALYGYIPVGAWLYILEQDGGEPSKYKADSIGNASHVGVKTGEGLGAIHSSASRGCVAESKFEDKTIRNGGWNRVGLCKLLDYSLPAQRPDDTSPADPRPTLRSGDRSEDVKVLQRLLREHGYVLDVDGKFGPLTREAVLTYQGKTGLTRDGIVGPKTWAALQSRPEDARYTVTIAGLTETVAAQIVKEHGGMMVLEGGDGNG